MPTPLPFLVVLVCLSLAAPAAGAGHEPGDSRVADAAPVGAGTVDEGSSLDEGSAPDGSTTDPGPGLSVYRSQRWSRAYYPDRDAYANPVQSLLRPRVPWGVFDGDGYRIPATQFASVVGHSERVALLRHRRTVAVAAGGALGGAGLGLLIGGAVWGAEADPGRTGESRKTNLESHQRGVGAAVFFGSAMIGSGIAVVLSTLSRQRHVARFYAKEEADEAVDARNDRLRKALDLQWEDVESLREPARVRAPGSDKARPRAPKSRSKRP